MAIVVGHHRIAIRLRSAAIVEGILTGRFRIGLHRRLRLIASILGAVEKRRRR